MLLVLLIQKKRLLGMNIFNDYKAQRPEMPNELQITVASFMGIIEFFKLTNIKKSLVMRLMI